MSASEGSELDRLDARADALASQFGDDDDFSPSAAASSSSASSSAASSGSGVAAAAAVGPRKRARTAAPQKDRGPEDRNLEEDDAVLRAASWRDLEDTRRFLENDHRERFDVLISRWEGVDDGDDVDLNTGRVVHSMGHLDALAPQRNMALFDSDSDSDSENENESDAGDGRVKGDADAGIDPLYVVCQKPSPLLDMAVGMLAAQLRRPQPKRGAYGRATSVSS